MSVVSARNLNKSFGSTRAMDNVNFDVEPGSIVGLIGPNGAGKTTTLKAILGLTDLRVPSLSLVEIHVKEDMKS